MELLSQNFSKKESRSQQCLEMTKLDFLMFYQKAKIKQVIIDLIPQVNLLKVLKAAITLKVSNNKELGRSHHLEE